jgi:hypothetical protein
LAACGGSDDDAPPGARSDAAGLHRPGRDGDPGGFDRPADDRGRVTTAAVVAPSGSGAHRHPRVLPRQRQHLADRQQRAEDPVPGRAADRLEHEGGDVRWRRLRRLDPQRRRQRAARPADQPNPLARGYATFASDSGHQANALGSQDASSFANDEAVRNFGGDALKKTRDAAVFLINARYAAGAPTKAYFAGGSTGGREALAAIQRWPADWNGAIAWYPAWNDAAALLFGQKVNRTLAQPGAYPNTAKKGLILQASLEACDGLDGIVDGLVSNQLKCNATYDPATATVNGTALRCAGGADTGDTCLSDAQITALKTLNTGARFNFHLASGETEYRATTSGAATSAGPAPRRCRRPSRSWPWAPSRQPIRCRPPAGRMSGCSSTSGSSTRSPAIRASTR